MANQPSIKRALQEHTKETIIINGYIIPCIAVVVLVTNVLVIVVYLKKYQKTQNKIRKISSILYISIAIANMLSSVPSSIWNFYLFTIHRVTCYVPYRLCWIWNFFDTFDLFPHMASIWFVTILSVQRYMIIRQPFISSVKWTIKRLFAVLTVVWCATFFMQLPHIFDTSYELKNVTSNSSAEGGCLIYYADWTNNQGPRIFIVSYSIKLIGIVIIPSVLIIYCDVSLVSFLRESSNIRKILVKTSSTSTSNSLPTDRESVGTETRDFQGNSTTSELRQTLLVVILSSVVFIVEIPYAILLVIYIYFFSIENYDVIQWLGTGPAENVVSLTMHVSYPTLFILSCLLSRQFRRLLWNIFHSKKKDKFYAQGKKTAKEDTASQALCSV